MDIFVIIVEFLSNGRIGTIYFVSLIFLIPAFLKIGVKRYSADVLCKISEDDHDFDLLMLDIVIDTESRMVFQNGKQVELTLKEYELLLLFVRNKNRALYRETIYENVWGGEYSGTGRTVDLHVQRLKKKLGLEEHITAIYKVGYRLVV